MKFIPFVRLVAPAVLVLLQLNGQAVAVNTTQELHGVQLSRDQAGGVSAKLSAADLTVSVHFDGNTALIHMSGNEKTRDLRLKQDVGRTWSLILGWNPRYISSQLQRCVGIFMFRLTENHLPCFPHYKAELKAFIFLSCQNHKHNCDYMFKMIYSHISFNLHCGTRNTHKCKSCSIRGCTE